MTINDKKADVMEITHWNDGTTRIPLFDCAETLALDFGKGYPVGSDCYCYDPMKITFSETAKGKKLPFVATYKTGATFKGTLQRVKFNEWEQKAYDRKVSVINTMNGIKRDAEKKEAEYKRKQSEEEEIRRLQIRDLKHKAGEPEGQTTESEKARQYVLTNWPKFQAMKKANESRYTYAKFFSHANYHEELVGYKIKNGAHVKKILHAKVESNRKKAKKSSHQK